MKIILVAVMNRVTVRRMMPRVGNAGPALNAGGGCRLKRLVQSASDADGGWLDAGGMAGLITSIRWIIDMLRELLRYLAWLVLIIAALALVGGFRYFVEWIARLIWS